MKNSLIIFVGLLFLGVSLIISSSMISNAIKDNLITVDGSLYLDNHGETDKVESEVTEYLAVGEVAGYLRYDDMSKFESDVINGKIESLPYINIDGNLLFSKETFNEWLKEASKAQLSIMNRD